MKSFLSWLEDVSTGATTTAPVGSPGATISSDIAAYPRPFGSTFRNQFPRRKSLSRAKTSRRHKKKKRRL